MRPIDDLRVHKRLVSTIGPLLAGALALSLYVSTAAPDLTWKHHGADGGDLIAAAATVGVPHPSGYPLYCLLARSYVTLSRALVAGEPLARHYNLFSATAAALSASLVYLCARQELRERGMERASAVTMEGISFGAALLWASGATLWSQALITEVYALSALFAALALYLTLRISGAPLPCSLSQTHPRTASVRPWLPWFALGLALGIGLGAHVTLALMVPGLLLWVWPRRSPGGLAALFLGGMAGAAVFLYLPLAATQDPPVNWGDPQTWNGFWWLVSGRLYRGYLFSLPLGELPARTAAYLSQLRSEFTLFGLALALLCLVQPAQTRLKRLGGLLILGLYGLYAIGYNTTDSYVYLIPSYLVIILWLCQGVAWSITETLRWWPGHGRLLRIGGAILLLALPLVSVALNYRALDVSTDRQAREWLDQVAQLPEGSLLITGADAHTFAMDYMLWARGERRDLLVIDGELLPYPWYRRQLAVRYPGVDIPLGPPIAIVQVLSVDRPVFLSRPRPELEDRYELRPWGDLWRTRERA